MKSENKTRRFAKLFSQYLPSTMVFKCGLVLLIICTVAAFVIAYYHDAYSSILEMKELAATDVWFKLFVILMVLGAALLVGSPSPGDDTCRNFNDISQQGTRSDRGKTC